MYCVNTVCNTNWALFAFGCFVIRIQKNKSIHYMNCTYEYILYMSRLNREKKVARFPRPGQLHYIFVHKFAICIKNMHVIPTLHTNIQV